jgi:hypothetical protein
MSIIHDTITKTCAQCGREFGVSYPDQWAYKTGAARKKFFCSWSCLRQAETEGTINMTKLTLDDKKHAVKIALDGGNPLEYIRMCGVKNAAESWMKIKNDLKLKDPETWEKLPKRLPQVKKEEAVPDPATMVQGSVRPVITKMSLEETGVTVKDITPKEIQKHMKPEVLDRPVLYSGFVVTAVEGEYGRYFHDKTSMGDYIDYESKDGDELSMTIDQWRAFLKELHHAAVVLGVKL